MVLLAILVGFGGWPLMIWFGYMLRMVEAYPGAWWRPYSRAEREADAETVADKKTPLRACPACGDRYHPSWGYLCPNCSGAD